MVEKIEEVEDPRLQNMIQLTHTEGENKHSLNRLLLLNLGNLG